ncbi:hypothetical protein O3G_MSEX008152 [Manduca sexta]|nr:hypothetical protein O3G_MSEX008152 [Manduca sexta]KAG6453432.1 hypothetical protein O3G_MSEX008152 [Manduca sexta]
MGLLITFCDSEGWFRLLVFLKSLFYSANFYMGLLIVCEIASNRWRSRLSMIVIAPRLLASVCMVPLGNHALNSETYNFVSSILCIVYIILLRWTPESPQWLLFNRRVELAEKILLDAAKRNGIKLCDDFKIRPINHRVYNSIDESATCVGVLSTHNTRVIVLVICVFWLLYYFSWSSLYVRVYSEKNTSQLLIKTFCFIGTLGCLTAILSAKLTLRCLLLGHVLVAGVCTCGVIFFSKGFLHDILSAFAIGSGVIGQTLLLNITPRLFAINIRTTILGCCHAAGQLGSMISYIFFMFHPLTDITSMAVHIVVTLGLAGLCLALLDVDGRELPDVIEDMDYFSELSKPLRWVSQKTSSPSIEEVEIRVYSFGSAGRSLSTPSNLVEREPAQPIGYLKLWPRFVKCMRRTH